MKFVATCLLLASLTAPAFCAEQTKPAKAELTKAQREEMAATHEKMAACLRSDKPFEDCHKDMMKMHKSMHESCSMMDKGHKHAMKHGAEEGKDDGEK